MLQSDNQKRRLSTRRKQEYFKFVLLIEFQLFGY